MLLIIIIAFIAWLYFEIKRKSWHTLALGLICFLPFYLECHRLSHRYCELSAKYAQKQKAHPEYDKLLFLREEAMDAYLNETPEVGIWALERLIAFDEDAGNPVWGGPFANGNERYVDLALARTRLALTLQRAGREKDAEHMLKLAVNIARFRYDEEATPETLVHMVNRLDEKKKKSSQKLVPGIL